MEAVEALALVAGHVDEELLLRNEYLAAENEILRSKIQGRVPMPNAERIRLAKLGRRIGMKALKDIAAIVTPEPIVAWFRRLVAEKYDGSRNRGPGRPPIDPEVERLIEREDAQGNLAAALSRLLDAARVETMVELGAGTGRLTRMLAPRLRSVKAFDASEAMLSVARRKLHELGIHNCQLAVAENAELPIEDASADLVIAGWAIGHNVGWHPDSWRQRVERVLVEMQRVARFGGLLVIIETLGTGHRTPTPPPHLVPYFDMVEERGFTREAVRTDYRFASPAEAEELVRFFFGDELAAQVSESDRPTLPECIGIWKRS